MEKQADQEQNLYIQQKYVAEFGNKSIFEYLFNCLKQIKSIIPKFNIHTDQSKINLCNPTRGQDVGECQEIGSQAKLDKHISKRMEVIETKLLPPEVNIRNQKAAREPATGKNVNDIVEQKAALIPNPRPDIVGLLSPRYIKSSDSCLMSSRSNSEFIDISLLCAKELTPIDPTSERQKLNLMQTSPISNDISCTDNKKIFNFADINTLKLATLIQTMIIDVLNLTQNVNNNRVSIEGFSFKMSVDIRKGKQGAIDSTELNDKIGSISKQLAFQFKEVLPAVAYQQELNTITTTCIEKQPQDEILYDDQLLVVEEEQEMSSLADSVCSDDTLTLENVISVVDLTCYDELNNQELKSICTTSMEELLQAEILYEDELPAVEEEEMSNIADEDCSDYALQNGISIFDLTCYNEFNKQELKAIGATSIEELPKNELFNCDKLLVVEKVKLSSITDGVYSDNKYTVENRISKFDLTTNNEFNKQELKAIATTTIEELLQDGILLGDQLLTINKEEEISSMADGVCSNETLIIENIMSMQDLKSNDELLCKDKKEISTTKLNLGFNKMVITDFNNELTEITTNKSNNELLKISSTELCNELIEMATIKCNNELCEIKSKDEVKHCSAIMKRSTIYVNKASSSEHSTLKINLSFSKYYSVTEDFLKILSILNDTSDDGPLKSSVMVPAFYFRTWYFHNIRQGFLLNILLRKSNVGTLNYMRNLYFIIITTDSQSISIAINFALQNEIFLHFKEPSFYFTGDCCKYTVSAKEVQQIFSPETGIVESCTTYEESNSNNSNIQSRSDLTSIYSTLLAEKINAATSYFYFDLFGELQRIDVAVGESNLELQSDIKLCGMNIFQSKTWLESMLNVPKNEIGTFFIHDVNETVFEQFSVDRYMEAAFGKGNTSIFSSAGNSNFYKIFFKCLGHTIACTMLSFFISML